MEGGAPRVTELRSAAEFAEAFGVIRELHRDLDERRYTELIPEMRAAGYRMFAVREGDRLLAVAGVQRLTNLYHGRHFYVYDLSVTEGARSKGHGERLLRHVEEVARGEGCGYVALACGRERGGALRFYEDRMGYESPGFSMRKALPA
jgi:GNAT superfamily N-acetyltransferase